MTWDESFSLVGYRPLVNPCGMSVKVAMYPDAWEYFPELSADYRDELFVFLGCLTVSRPADFRVDLVVRTRGYRKVEPASFFGPPADSRLVHGDHEFDRKQVLLLLRQFLFWPKYLNP